MARTISESEASELIAQARELAKLGTPIGANAFRTTEIALEHIRPRYLKGAILDVHTQPLSTGRGQGISLDDGNEFAAVIVDIHGNVTINHGRTTGNPEKPTAVSEGSKAARRTAKMIRSMTQRVNA